MIPARPRRRVYLLVGVGLLLLLVARAGLDGFAARRVSAEQARLEARYGSLDESTLRSSPVPEAGNRARLLRAAAVLTIPEPGAGTGLRGGRFVNTGAASPVPSNLRAFVEANRAAIRLAGEARALREWSWDTAYRHAGDLPPWKELRTLSYALYLSARLDLEAGRPDQAARAIATGLAVAASLRQEPAVIVQLLRIAIANEQLDGMERLLSEGKPSGTALDELAESLAENRSPDPMQVGLVGDLKIYNGQWTRAATNQFDPPTSGPRLLLGPLVWLERPFIRLAHARYLRSMGRLLDSPAGAREQPESRSRSWLVGIGTEMLASGSGLAHAVAAEDEFKNHLAQAETAVALRR